MKLKNKKIGIAFTASYCTLEKVFLELNKFKDKNCEIIPIVSDNILKYNTRFGNTEKWINKIKELTNNEIIDSIIKAEPIGPKKLLDLLIIAPCTGNTMAKIANGIIDETVVMAVKAQLRNKRPVLIAMASNDGLSLNSKSISKLLNTENVYFVPFGQDAPFNKENSLVARMDLILKSTEYALDKKQIQPVIIEHKGLL
ncbi:MAG: dipicolinate synthase subunit B [Bacillota bacterium]